MCDWLGEAFSSTVMRPPSYLDGTVVSGSLLRVSPGREVVGSRELRLSSLHMTMTALSPPPQIVFFNCFLEVSDCSFGGLSEGFVCMMLALLYLLEKLFQHR